MVQNDHLWPVVERQIDHVLASYDNATQLTKELAQLDHYCAALEKRHSWEAIASGIGDVLFNLGEAESLHIMPSAQDLFDEALWQSRADEICDYLQSKHERRVWKTTGGHALHDSLAQLLQAAEQAPKPLRAQADEDSVGMHLANLRELDRQIVNLQDFLGIALVEQQNAAGRHLAFLKQPEPGGMHFDPPEPSASEYAENAWRIETLNRSELNVLQ